jgi:hypothetical protein
LISLRAKAARQKKQPFPRMRVRTAVGDVATLRSIGFGVDTTGRKNDHQQK